MLKKFGEYITGPVQACPCCHEKVVLQSDGGCQTCGLWFVKTDTYLENDLVLFGVQRQDVNYPHLNLRQFSMLEIFNDYRDSTSKKMLFDDYFLTWLYKHRRKYRANYPQIDWNWLRKYYLESKNK